MAKFNASACSKSHEIILTQPLTRNGPGRKQRVWRLSASTKGDHRHRLISADPIALLAKLLGWQSILGGATAIGKLFVRLAKRWSARQWPIQANACSKSAEKLLNASFGKVFRVRTGQAC